MQRLPRLFVVAATAAVLLAMTTSPSSALAAPSATRSPFTGQRSSSATCALPQRGHMACLSRVATVNGRRMSSLAARQPAAAPQTSAGCATVGGYGPSDIQRAYNVSAAASTTGSNQTVGVIDAYDNPNAAQDLASYRGCWGLPSCTAANGCFSKVDQNGGTTFVPAGRTSAQAGYGWGLEIALDLDAVSSACPNCHILLVEASSGADSDITAAVQRAVTLGATQLSMSFGGCEGAPDQAQFDSVLNAAGMPITVASGDAGYLSSDNPSQVNAQTRCPVDGAPSYPASSPYVTAAGGTSLVTSATPRGWSETAWSYSRSSGGGSGCSANEPKPIWQHDPGCPRRTVADVAADSDPNTGLATFDTWDDSGWDIVGGTSLAAPLISGIQSLGPAAPGSIGGQRWYAAAVSANDITVGTNAPSGATDCAPQTYLCVAQSGYDGPSGVGSPNGPTTAVAPTLTPATSEFGIPGSQHTLTLTNWGAQLLVIAGVTVSGPNASSFSLANPSPAPGTLPGCVGARLSSGQACILQASYTGTAQGPATVAVEDGSVTPPTATLVADGVAVATGQYSLADSDGSTWQVIDAAALAVAVTPSASGSLIVSGNADLWTATGGYNQDIGICFTTGALPTSTCPASEVVSWKESGGFAGTFSPNAAFVQYVLPSAAAGATYSATLVWKTNHPAPSSATIHAGAGPISGQFSPTRLAVRWFPNGTVQTTAISTQPRLTNQPSTSWQLMDPSGLHLELASAQASQALISVNADLWTMTAGYNQDVGVCVTSALPSSCTDSQVIGWKESGGFAGTFSPNAAYLQANLVMTANQTYEAYVVWKPNHGGSATIVAGAGGAIQGFSPTWLTAVLQVPAVNSLSEAVSPVTAQYSMSNPSSQQWVPMGAALALDQATTGSCLVTLTADVDLWTATAGVNQDVAIIITPGGGASGSVAGWKESGGFAGIFSPNAASLQVSFLTQPGITYHVQLGWKANHTVAGSRIFAGAGSPNAFSPTSLVAETASSACW